MTVSYIWRFFGIMMLAAPIYILVRRLILRHQRKMNKDFRSSAGREVCMGLFFLYVTGLLMLALVMDARYGSLSDMIQSARERLETGGRINLVPFLTISGFLEDSTTRDVFLINIVGNVIMFVPWGFGLALLWKKNRNIPRLLMWSAVLPLFIETWQLFIGRSVDVDDWILNFAGSILGGLVYMGWTGIKGKSFIKLLPC